MYKHLLKGSFTNYVMHFSLFFDHLPTYSYVLASILMLHTVSEDEYGPIVSIWSKKGNLIWVWNHLKVLSCCCLTYISKPVQRDFKRRTVWHFILKDIRNTSRQTFGYYRLFNKVGHFWNFWVWLVIILMPLEIELRAVPHLKVFINRHLRYQGSNF